MHFESGMSENSWNKLSGTEKRSHPAFVRAVNELTKKKSRIKEYNKQVIPFILRKTMYHLLSSRVLFNNKWFSKSGS